MEKTQLKRGVVFGADFVHKRPVIGDAGTVAVITLIAAAVGGFFIGRVILFGMLSTLSAAYVFSFITEDRRFYAVWAAVFLGLLTSGTGELWRYTAILVFAAVSDVIYKDKPPVSPVRKGVLCALAVIITGGVKYIAVTRLDFVLFITAVEALLSFLSVQAFCKTKSVLDKPGLVSGEKAMSLYFTAAVSAAALGGLAVYGVDLFMVLAVFFIMYFSLGGGISSGAAIGTFIGLAALCTGASGVRMFAVFSVMGLFGGLFRRYGKLGVILAGAFSGPAVLFYIGGETITLETGIAFAAGAAAFALSPALFATEADILCSDGSYDFFKAHSSKRMESVARAIGSISSAMDNAATEVSAKERIDRIIDSTVSRVCSDCGMSAYCWGSEIEMTYRSFYKFTGECGKRGSVTEADMPETMAKTCVRLKTITDITNRNLDFYRQDMVWDSRVKEYMAADKKRTEIIGKVLNTLSASVKDDYKLNKALSSKILAALKDELRTAVKVQAFTVKGVPGVYVFGSEVDVSAVISAAAGRRYVLSGSTGGMDSADIYSAVPKYKATFAVSDKPKTGNAVTGDSYGDVCTDKGLGLILSDGMGTGENARAQSMKTVELAESFFNAGLNGETVTELLDTLFMTDEESFATADILETNLYEGKARFVKTGAAASYIIREGRIKTINSPSLPPGLRVEHESNVTDVALKDGDIIIMATDGLTDAVLAGSDEGKWLKDIFDSLSSKDPRFISDSILKEAERLRGIASDDMTVAVIRIWEPY